MTLAGDERSSAPDGDVDDALEERKSHPSVVADTPDGLRLQRLLEAIEGFGDDAEWYYEETLAEAREHRGGVLFEIARALGDCHDDDYPMRWSLTHAATSIGGESALPLLANVAQTPIPDEVSPEPHSFSSVEEETIIRTTAVDGISELAKEGSDEAVDILMELVTLPSFSIRRAAVTGLKASPKGEELVDRIADCLPKDERFLLDLKAVDVKKVDQVEDPRRHLSEAGREARTASPPGFGDAKERDVDPAPTDKSQANRPASAEQRDEEEGGK